MIFRFLIPAFAFWSVAMFMAFICGSRCPNPSWDTYGIIAIIVAVVGGFFVGWRMDKHLSY